MTNLFRSFLATMRQSRPSARRRRRHLETRKSEQLECRVLLSAPVVESFVLAPSGPTHLEGTVSDDNGAGGLEVEIDLNNGSEYEAVLTDANGDFSYEFGEDVYGTNTVWARAIDNNGEVGAWKSTTFTISPPEVTSLTIANDTGTPGDGATSDASVAGTITNINGSLGGMLVEIDYGGSNTASVLTDSNGDFSLDANGMIPLGAATVKARTVTFRLDGNEVYGDWVTLNFTHVAPEPAEFVSLELANDTGTSNTDKVTTDATITGTIQSARPVDDVLIEVDLDGDGTPDDYAVVNSDGTFTYDANSAVSPGNVSIKVRTSEWDPESEQYVFGAWITFNFVLEST